MMGNHTTKFLRLTPHLRKAVLALAVAVCAACPARGDFSGTPQTFTTDGGWCWFQDPRAIITNGHLIIGTTAGVTVTGAATAGDEVATDYNVATGAISTFTLKAAYNRDDHASPAFTVLPDGRVLVVYAGHGADVYAFWRVSTGVGNGSTWGAEQTSVVNTVNDGNNNSYSNPFYLSVPNTVYNFSRAIGYDTNYSRISGISASDNSGLTSAANFSYGGHFQYWQNPNGGSLVAGNGGNGRPYVKYTSNGTDTIWLATTEDSPQNYANSLYAGYVKFDSTGAGTVYTTAGTVLGAISSGTAPTSSNGNPPTSGGNQGAIASGTGYSYQPYQFAPIVKANANVNGYNLTSSSPYGAGYAPWGSAMRLDSSGNPYLGFVVMRNLTGAYGKNLEYGYARLVNGVWKTSRIGYAGYALYSGQNQYAGLIALDAVDPNKVYFSANVNPSTGADLLGPDGVRHWQIFQGTTTDGSTWSFTQLTNTSSDNVRPILAAGGGTEALLWMQGTYTSYTNYNTNVVGLIQTIGPAISLTTPLGSTTVLASTGNRLRVAAGVTENGSSVVPTVQWSTVSGPASAVFANAASADTTVQFPQAGTYVLRLSATDGVQTAVASLTVVVSSGTQDTALVLWQKLNETSGTTAADSSGKGNNGTLIGGTTWLPTGGVRGGALQFNGTSGYATTPDATGTASQLDNTAAFTLAFWFRATSFSGTPGLVSKRDAIATNNNYTTYLTTDGHLTVDIESNNDRFASNTVFATNTWYHVALVFTGSNPTASRAALYVNGVLDKTASETSTALSDSPSTFKLGVTSAASNYLSGLLDDVRFYRRALTADEVNILANGLPAPSVSCGTAPSARSGVAVTLAGTVADNDGGAVTALWSEVSGPGTVTFGDASLAATTATFSQAGTYVLQLAASNANSEVRDQVTITVTANSSVYADWISAAFPGVTASNVVGPLADPDGDGVVNLMEFALGLTPGKGDAAPATATAAGLPVVSTVTDGSVNYLALQVRRPTGLLGITYTAQVSGDLVNWTATVQAGTPVPQGDSAETVTFRDTVPVSQSSRRFIRLQVSQ